MMVLNDGGDHDYGSSLGQLSISERWFGFHWNRFESAHHLRLGDIQDQPVSIRPFLGECQSGSQGQCVHLRLIALNLAINSQDFLAVGNQRCSQILGAKVQRILGWFFLLFPFLFFICPILRGKDRPGNGYAIDENGNYGSNCSAQTLGKPGGAQSVFGTPPVSFAIISAGRGRKESQPTK